MSVRRKHVDNNNMWAVDREGISGGLLLLWNDKIKVNVLSWSKGHIHAILAGQNFLPWFFTGFYGHPVPSLRSQSWDLLRKLEKDIYGAWICGGDFNEIVGNEEKFGGMQRNYVAMNNFKEVLNECKLIDFGKVKGEMTWRNDVLHPGEKCGKVKRKTRFHFEEAWCDEEFCKKVVLEVWRDSQNDGCAQTFKNKLMKCGIMLDRWNKKNKGQWKKMRYIGDREVELCGLNGEIQTQNIFITKLLQGERKMKFWD
ncbi:hypothetical protein POM88_047648 [Heracleum sosnowskyi]|uniref:Uncharacterized protein n=1 Tax=Heracleum sosnowskyi TaxID=360622 RepID=A0AAD8LZU8_9APIA|nr:hypothetical protein POM88_047648 [Heracleum sosnowskyi]